MQLIVLFGLPGTGKTYIGSILQKEFGFYLHDGDTNLPKDMQEALSTHAPVSEDMRDRFFQSIIETTRGLEKTYKKIVIAQTLIKEKYREQFLNTFPNTTFILIETPTYLREERLVKRKSFPLAIEYARNMVLMFDKPLIPYKVIKNDVDGDEILKEKLTLLLS